MTVKKKKSNISAATQAKTQICFFFSGRYVCVKVKVTFCSWFLAVFERLDLFVLQMEAINAFEFVVLAWDWGNICDVENCEADICEADVEAKLRTVDEAELRNLLVCLLYVGEGDGDGESEGDDRLVWLGSFSCWTMLLERFWNMLRLDCAGELDWVELVELACETVSYLKENEK